MKVLFVVPPLAGHINPTVAVAAELAARGHRVAWTGPAEVLPRLLPAGAELLPSGDRADSAGYGSLHAHWRDLRGVAALRFLWEEALVPLAHAMLPGVEAAVDTYEPDVLVVDQQALAGAVIAQRRGLPWVTSATTSAEFTRPFAGFPRVGEWVAQKIAGLLADCGAPGGWDPRFSDRLVLVFSTLELVGADESSPGHYAFVGPALSPRPSDGSAFPWQRLDPARRRVLVSLGTLNREAGGRFYAQTLRAAERLADRVQLILAAPADVVGEVPDHVLLLEHVPQLPLLPHLDAVVSHGGHNTVCEALAHGLPLVVAPIRDDQPIVAQQVAAAGAGIRVRFGRARSDELHDALAAVLDDPAHRRAARRIQASFAAAGGAAAAADRLEKLI
ncbi:glycosyltransferase family 1 protein [Streptomyces lunaelactis]|uniref:glycosyltransferase n=1 Tax=Streptomyces lunaelactis TaxID=1535768 RepID=UPI0015854CC5|nr:glycosyltransferase [Streptomyces lunaelactis]NUK70746.1 glycosyltransferase family 1 protein [Streptomyces lunaelactis]NUK77332.1 glycosyltransferase family 1 protein [Streptomyces lunaelactis]